jgi:hypothetical protein
VERPPYEIFVKWHDRGYEKDLFRSGKSRLTQRDYLALIHLIGPAALTEARTLRYKIIHKDVGGHEPLEPQGEKDGREESQED